MIRLDEYVKLNRCSSAVSVKGVDFGEFYSDSRAIYYDVPVSDGVKSVFAFISVPTSPMPEGGYPAVLILHGGNGAAYYEITRLWAQKGYVAIAPDFNSRCAESILRRDTLNANGGPCGYGTFDDITRQHPWEFFSVLSAMRAIDVLIEMPEVNASKICSCGLSWGGFLNLLLLSVDSRVAAGSVIYSSAYISDSEWGNRSDHLGRLSSESKGLYADNLDPGSYLPKISCPVLFTAGTQDRAFKMENRRKTAENISGATYFALRHDYFHGNFYGFEQPESAEFFTRVLNGKAVPQPAIILLDNAVAEVKPYFACSDIKLLVTDCDVIATEIQNWREERPDENGRVALRDGDRAVVAVESYGGMTWSTNMVLIADK